MNIYPEIPCSITRNLTIDGKDVSYTVRQFGIKGVVYEEILTPIPDVKTAVKTVTILNSDGTKDTVNSYTKTVESEVQYDGQ